MTEHVARARRPRGKGLRSAAAKRRKHRTTTPAGTTPRTADRQENYR